MCRVTAVGRGRRGSARAAAHVGGTARAAWRANRLVGRELAGKVTTGAGAGGYVGRGGLRRGCRAGGGGRARGDRRASGAVRQPAVVPVGGARVLHAGGRAGCAAG